MAQARIGQDFLTQYCKRCLVLGIHLVINHHMAMHYYDMIKRFGPVYGWWLFAFERFNGLLEKVKLNGHDGGRMEVTLLRNWVQSHLLYELLLSLPEDAHELERKIINEIITNEGKRGGMMTQIAILQGEANNGRVHLCSCTKYMANTFHHLRVVGHCCIVLLLFPLSLLSFL